MRASRALVVAMAVCAAAAAVGLRFGPNDPGRLNYRSGPRARGGAQRRVARPGRVRTPPAREPVGQWLGASVMEARERAVPAVERARDLAQPIVARVTRPLTSVAERLNKPVQLPTWAVGAGGTALATFALSVALAVQSIQQPTELEKEVVLFGDVLRNVDDSYVEPVDTRALFERGTNAMLHSLDPFTEFENAASKADLDMFTRGAYGGVGLAIGPDPYVPGRVLVREARESYAFEDGLRVGDHLVSVGGEPVDGAQLDTVMTRLRGDPGTAVEVVFERDGDATGTKRVATLHRKQVLVNAVPFAGLTSLSESSSAGYVKLAQFSATAPAEMRSALVELQVQAARQGKSMDALVLDLRGNAGGLLTSALQVTEQFVPHGMPIVSTQGRDPDSRVTYVSGASPLIPFGTRVAVLIDERTASASEIVAGALQDLDRALILGTQHSYGKGLVQSVLPLRYDTELKYTIAKYYTPSGRCIQRVDYDGNGGVVGRDGAPSAVAAAPTEPDPSKEAAPSASPGTAAPDVAAPGALPPPASAPARSAPQGGYVGRVRGDGERIAYQTLHGRQVRDGGGIEADIVLKSSRPGLLERALSQTDAFFAFAREQTLRATPTADQPPETALASAAAADGAPAVSDEAVSGATAVAGPPQSALPAGHPPLPPAQTPPTTAVKGFEVTPAVLSDFEKFALRRAEELGPDALASPAELRVQALRSELVEEDGYSTAELEALNLESLKDRAHKKFVGALKGEEKDSIARRIALAVDARSTPERSLLARTLRSDPNLDRAIAAIQDDVTYYNQFGFDWDKLNAEYGGEGASGADAQQGADALGTGKTTMRTLPPTRPGRAQMAAAEAALLRFSGKTVTSADAPERLALAPEMLERVWWG